MSSQPASEPPPRKSKQQASRNITEQSRKRPADMTNTSDNVSFPSSVYGNTDEIVEISVPPIVRQRTVIQETLLKTVSEMYFGSIDPFGDILRSLDDRVDRDKNKYVSALDVMLKAELSDNGNNSKAKLAREKVVVTPLDALTCSFRRTEAIDMWAPIEVAMFELSVCQNKGFNPKKMAPLFEGKKTVKDLNQFFEDVYSKSDNWKKIQKIINRESLTDEDEEEMEEDSVKSLDDVEFHESPPK